MKKKNWNFDKNILPIEKMDDLLFEKIDQKYEIASPYPHVVIDNFFDEEYLDWILEEFPDKDKIDWNIFDKKDEIKLATKRESQIGFFTKYFIYNLNSSVFIDFLERITGVRNLIPDPHLAGGGLHQILKGGKLGIHVDFNKDERLKVNRKLNVLIYLNKDWEEKYGGYFELWDKDIKKCIKKVLPIYNRMVIFTTNDISYHGHPEPLTCPENMTRKSIALYYYASEDNSNKDEKEVYKERHDTIFKNNQKQSQNKQCKIFSKLGYEEGYKVIQNFKKTGEIDISNSFDPEIIDLSTVAFLNILEPKEIERKNYIFSAFDNINFDEVKTDFDEINNFMLNQFYKAGFIKGFAYAMKNKLKYDISLETKIQKNPLISVIIPAYNDEDTIEYAIDSVLKQTYKNIEILVIDDGSSDKTSELVKKIQKNDSRIIYIRQSNTGVAGARNRGVKESKGEYIKLCDSDDVLFPYALEMMVRALKFTNETQKFIFDDYCLYFPEDEKLLPKSMTKPKTKNEAFKIQLIGNVYPVGSVLIEKETLIKEGMFDPTLNGTDDYDLWNRLLVKHNFYKIELTPMYLQFCYKAQLSSDLETLRCYTDISGLKFTNSVDFTNVIENKETYNYMIDQMINRDDMCPSTITNLNKSFYAKNIINKKEYNNINLRTLEKSNEVFLEYHKKYITYPPDYKINDKETIAKTFIQSGFLRNKINKISFFDDENEKFFFDFYEYEKFYGHLQLKKEDKYSHIILSNSWVYSVIPDDWITLFNQVIDRIIVPSKFIKNNYNNLGIVDYKIDVVGLPVNSSMYYKKETNYDLETNKRFNFFCISKFTKSSGIDNLIKAYTSEFTKNDDVCLIIMNDFIYDYEKKIEIEAFIENNKELPKIIIKQNNFIKEELCDIYNTVDCYVYPYSLEKFGIHVAEAMLCELPVIVTKYGATDDFCNSDNSYQIEAELIQKNYTLSGINTSGDSFNFLQPDLDNLKKIMKNIFNSTKNNELGKKARKIIVEKYNEKTISDKIISIVTDVEKEPVLRTNFLDIKKKLEEKANRFFDQKNYEMAEEMFNNLSKFEKNTDFYKKLAISQYKLKKYDDAVFSFSLLIENGILTKDICIMMADSLEKIGADEEAKEFKSRAKSL